MDEPLEEGWYTDPFARHEARWLSEGKPTRLVRDGDVEADDEPPDEPPTAVPVRIAAEADSSSAEEDIRRADDVEAHDGYDSEKATRAAFDVFDETEQ